eukprot:CAMPEP_0116891306 /NCGR_PEP_ID=MMETSP0467-20121206/1754_1 /TAXON_ID=283647 /ORGANISM="Mesodinium pulex, Strain SPMC105" /LENGTH=84 /DNA_ID=CAMNT_0004559753 /DNA_START=75 /DNA_END=329 /DNA_ORIENTATION=+
MGWRFDFGKKEFVSENNIAANRLKWDIHNPVVGVENPTFLKKGTRSKVAYYGLFAGVGLGFAAVLYGEYCMIVGVGQKPMKKEW